jgi:hypothetical protein
MTKRDKFDQPKKDLGVQGFDTWPYPKPKFGQSGANQSQSFGNCGTLVASGDFSSVQGCDMMKD